MELPKLPDPEDKKVAVTIYLTEKKYKKFRELAEKSGRSVSQILDFWIESFIKQEEKKNKS